MRNATLHITRTSLIKLLERAKVTNSSEVASRLIREGYALRVRDRYIIKARTKKIKGQLDKLQVLSSEYAAKFNLILYTIRTKYKHQFIKTIRKGDSEYNVLKEVSEFAHDFIKLYKISSITEGYKIYIEIGLELMGKVYRLNKFKFLNSNIHQTYENYLTVLHDKDTKGTTEFYGIWKDLLRRYSNMPESINNKEKNTYKDLSKRANLVWGREEADSQKADYRAWIEAQFEQLVWLNAVPEINQLFGDNAIKRYLKASKTQPNNNSFEKTVSEDEKRYWEAINKVSPK